MAYDICSTDPGALTQDACAKIAGRVREIWLIRSDEFTGLDLTDAAAIDALVASAPSAYNVAEVRGEYARPAATTDEGFGDSEVQPVSYTHVVHIMHNVIKENRNFWNALNGRSEYYLGFRVGDIANDLVMWSTVPVTIDAGAVVQMDKKTQTVWDITATWSSIEMPTMEIIPA